MSSPPSVAKAMAGIDPVDEPSSGVEQRIAAGSPPSDKSRPTLYMHAGQIVVSSEARSISTVVGSCVALYLFDPIRRAGGGNHYVLPLGGRGEIGSARYGDAAIPDLIKGLLALGCREIDLQAKIMGGASIIKGSERGGAESLGMQNVRIAREILAARGIPVLAEDVGGTRGRRVIFHTDNGDVWVRRL